MGWCLVAVGAMVAIGLGAAALSDRRARKQGHQLRSGSEMSLSARDNWRDGRAFKDTPVIASGSVSWMAYLRGKRGRRAKSEPADD